MPDQHGRTLGKRTVAAVAIDAGPQGGAATEESVTIGNGLYLLGRIGGSGVSFLVDTGSGVSILAARKWKEWGRTEDELTRYWGRLCSVEGRALKCLGKARLTVTLGTRVVEWGFIVAEIGDDEGILGNDFAMAHELTVRPCEGAVYLPDHAETGRGHLGERLPCTVRVVTEVRTITEETLAVRAVGPATLAPHAITQVRVIVPTPWACGTVMVDRGPGPLGLCPVRGIVEVEQASNIWLANPGSRPIQLDGDEVVALAECVLAGPGASAGSDRDIGDEVNGLVERASPHLTREECRQLQMAMAARKHLFAKGKGDLGRTDIVQHRIHTGDQPAIKQRVRRYPAARREEERQLVEDMLAIGIIQESNSAWSSPTVLVKKKDGTTRFCIDYRRLNQATKVDAYPLPHIEDSLNTLGGARFFCSLDLASGYWQVEMEAACRETKQEWDELVPLILMSYRATPQASTGVTPNMMMLGRQTRLPVQAMYGAPLGPEEEASTVSEYVAALQGGLRAAYRHARAGLQRAALHQKHDYDGKVQRREYQAGELVWIHDITLERTRGTKLQFPWFGPALITKVLDRGRVVVRRKRDKPLAVMHVDRLETYRGTAVPAWMTTEQRECVAV